MAKKKSQSEMVEQIIEEPEEIVVEVPVVETEIKETISSPVTSSKPKLDHATRHMLKRNKYFGKKYS